MSWRCPRLCWWVVTALSHLMPALVQERRAKGCGHWKINAQATCSQAWCSTAPMGTLCSTTGLAMTLHSTHTGAQPCTCPEGCVRAHWAHCLHVSCPEQCVAGWGVNCNRRPDQHTEIARTLSSVCWGLKCRTHSLQKRFTIAAHQPVNLQENNPENGHIHSVCNARECLSFCGACEWGLQ